MIEYVETHIVDHCNLNCKGCSHFSGLVEQPVFKSLEEYKSDITQLSKITNQQIRIIRIMGGEPLLHPQVIDFCIETRKILPSSQIVLVSNGILLNKLTDSDIELLNQNKIILDISNYGLKLNDNQLNKFSYKLYGNTKSLYNISLNLNGTQDKNISFQNCDLVQGGWYFLKKGRIYQCCIMANIEYFCKYFNKNIDYDLEDISIDIFSHTEEEIHQFLNTPHNICKYCDTIARHNAYSPFEVSKNQINEWIKPYQVDFSVIIPCHNLENYIKPLLLSFYALNLNNLNVEFIFTLDDCQDKTEDIIKFYMNQANLTYRLHKCNCHSCGSSRNEGFQFAKGKYVWFVDGDDWITNPYVLQDCFQLFEEHPDLPVIKLKYTSNIAAVENNCETTIWRHIFRKKSIQDLKFTAEVGEDGRFMDAFYRSLPEQSYIYYYDITSYFYNFDRPGSIMYNINHKKL